MELNIIDVAPTSAPKKPPAHKQKHRDHQERQIAWWKERNAEKRPRSEVDKSAVRESKVSRMDQVIEWKVQQWKAPPQPQQRFYERRRDFRPAATTTAAPPSQPAHPTSAPPAAISQPAPTPAPQTEPASTRPAPVSRQHSDFQEQSNSDFRSQSDKRPRSQHSDRKAPEKRSRTIGTAANMIPLGAPAPIIRSVQRAIPLEDQRHSYPYFRDPAPQDKSSAAATAASARPSRDVFSASTFAELDLDPKLVQALKEGPLQAETLTKTQSAAYPALFQGRDVMLRAETGSGKTLAFAIPIVRGLTSQQVSRDQGTYAIVVTPTRELALQIYDVFKAILKPFHWIVAGAVIGGEKRKSEKARLRKGVNILIATPGRLLDHLQATKSFNLNSLKWLVLDEADRLLDMGFEKDLTAIFETVGERARAQRQTVLTSATLHDRVMYVSQAKLNKPLYVGFDKDMARAYEEEELADLNLYEDQSFLTPKQLQHWFCVVPIKRRLVALTAFLRWKTSQAEECKIVVFLSSQDSVQFHHAMLTGVTMRPPSLGSGKLRTVTFDEDGEGVLEEEQEVDNSEHLLPIPVYKLHGGMRQEDRTQQFFAFAQSGTGVLLCTDVAARGLDLPAVQWIVQYDTPGVATEYIHRAGRTARLGQHGNALLFLGPQETAYLDILREMSVDLKEVSADEVLTTVAFDDSRGKSREYAIQQGVKNVQQLFQHYINTHPEAHELAMAGYQAALRAYATHAADTKHIFHIRKLHLGHFAKSFGLSEPPLSVSQQLRKKHQQAERDVRVKSKEKEQRQSFNYHAKMQTNQKAQLSEFA